MKVIWTEKKYLISTARLLDRDYVNRKGLDLSKEVLWVSLGQMEGELPAIKVGDLKKNSAAQPGAGKSGSNRADRQNFFLNSNFDSW